MSGSIVTNTEESFVDPGLNGNKYSFIDRCQFKINNDSHCLNRAVEFICGHCTNKFCLDHLTEHEHTKGGVQALRSNKVNSTSNVVRSIDLAKSSSITCTLSGSSCECSSICSCTTRSCLFELTLVSEESALIFHPIAASTPVHSVEHNTSPRQEMAENENYLSTNHFINVLNSTINNQQHLLDIDMTPDESINILPDGIASNHLLRTLEATLREISNTQKQNKTVQGGNSIKENNDRLNRSNFFLKNITTSMTYMEIFISIATMYPLVQLNTTENSSKIQYLCIADTSISSNEKLVSIHLCFQKKVNFKHKFLNHLFPNLKISDYLAVTNGDQFNAEIKLLANGKYIESSIYTTKKGKNALADVYRQKQGDIASVVFKQKSLPNAIAVLKESLPFEYLTAGNQMRNNIEYELQLAKKQNEIEYKPVYDSTTFKIPEEHREKIFEWLKNDFQMRIDGKITRSRCLFMIGPTQHGKTSWARSLGKHCSFVINFSLREWRDDVQYIILDDVHWKDICPIAKGLLIAPGEIILTDKYMTKISINNNKPCIVCINDNEGKIILDSDTDDYWKENGVWIHLKKGQKMF